MDYMSATPTMAIAAERALPELLNLLVVDDERAVREGCREAAEVLGYHTLTADRAETAYKLLETHAVDVVMLDLRLPGASGVEVLREVKRRRPTAEVIVITGNASVQSAVQAMHYGAYVYVTKPFNLDELKLLLQRVGAPWRPGPDSGRRSPRVDAALGWAGQCSRDGKLSGACQCHELGAGAAFG